MRDGRLAGFVIPRRTAGARAEILLGLALVLLLHGRIVGLVFLGRGEAGQIPARGVLGEPLARQILVLRAGTD